MREVVLQELFGFFVDGVDFDSGTQVLSDDSLESLNFFVGLLLFVDGIDQQSPGHVTIVAAVETSQAEKNAVRLEKIIIWLDEEFG